MISEPKYRTLVRASGLYDLIVTAPFATPWTFAIVERVLVAAHDASGARGSLPPFPASHALMAHLLGSVVTVWSILRIREPEVRFGRLDAIARGLFAAWMLYAVAHGASTIILGFFVVEVAFGVAQMLPVRAGSAVAVRDPALGELAAHGEAEVDVRA